MATTRLQGGTADEGRVQHELWTFEVLGHQAISSTCCDGIGECGHHNDHSWYGCGSIWKMSPIYYLTNWDIETNASFYMRGVEECLPFLMAGELESGCILFSWKRHRTPVHLFG